MKKITGKTVIIFFILFLFFTMFSSLFLTPVFNKVSPNVPIPDIAYSFSGNPPHELATLYGSAGINAYLGVQIFDIFYPLVYGIFFFITIVWLLRNNFSKETSSLLWYIPIAGVISDYIENFSIFLSFKSFPDQSMFASFFGRPASGLKWLFFSLSLIIILINLTIFLYRKIRNRQI